MHAPICPKHSLNAFPGRELLFFDRDDEIEHREALPISAVFFAQGGSHHFPLRETFFHAVWQRNDRLHFAPVPDSRLVWIPEPKPRHPCIQIQSQTVCLTFFAPIVASIGEHPNFEQRDGLQFFVRRGEALVLKEKVAPLLDHILQRDKAGFILVQALL
jgi:hypothetical protein